MRPMQTLEYAFLVSELGPGLSGKRFTKIYFLGSGRYRLKIGGRDLIVVPGQCLYAASQIPPSEELDNFSQKVRKELEGRHLDRIGLIGNDRIVSFGFGDFQLVFEMFGSGNALLLQRGKILACLKNEQWKDRTLKTGQAYQPPSPPPLHLADCLSDRYVASDMARLPYGTYYIKEALARCRIDEKKPGNTLSDPEKKTIERTLAFLLQEAKPLVFYSGGQPVDFGLLAFAMHASHTTKAAASFSEAVETCYLAIPALASPELEKLDRRLQKQQDALRLAREQEGAAKATGDFIYSHYSRIQDILELARAGKWEELQERFPSLSIDRKKKEIALEMME